MDLLTAISGAIHRHGGCTVYRHGVSIWGSDQDMLRILNAAAVHLERNGYDMRYVRKEIRRSAMKGAVQDAFKVQPE